MLPAQPPNSRRSPARERHVQDVYLVGQDVVLEAVLNTMMLSYAIEAADQCAHRGESPVKLVGTNYNRLSLVPGITVIDREPVSVSRYVLG
jgi:hypothetical protein